MIQFVLKLFNVYVKSNQIKPPNIANKELNFVEKGIPLLFSL